MLQSVSAAFPAEGSQASKARRKGATATEAELRGVIRVLINKNQRLQTPVLAAKKLAKHYQSLKEQLERVKESSYNFKVGMERAERRSAQLQQDFARSYAMSSGEGSVPMKNGGASNAEKPKGLPFYLPASTQQVIDALAAKNVMLMKSLAKVSDKSLRLDEILEENIQMEAQIKALKEELDLKSSLLEDYEAEASKKDLKTDSDKLARSIIAQRKECAELKSKLRMYESYVKHMRERNSAILDSVLTNLDKSNRIPVESVDGEASGAVAMTGRRAVSAPASQNVSRNNSRNGSRRDSLKTQSECELQSTGIQTDSGVSCASSARGSLDDVDMVAVMTEHEACQKEIKGLKDIKKVLSLQLQEKDSYENSMKQRLLDMEEMCSQMAADSEVINQQLCKEKEKVKELEIAKEDSEAIIKMMQERVDDVNTAHAESGNLKQKIRELEEKLNELPLMQQVLKNYEEEIKGYHVERTQLVNSEKQLKARNEQLEYENNRLQGRLRGLVAGQPMEYTQSSSDYKGWHSTSTKEKSQVKPSSTPFQQDPQLKEPWQAADWTGLGKPFGQAVVADGSKHTFDGPPDHLIHQAQRHRQLRNDSEDRRGSRATGEDDDDHDLRKYAESGIVKCENCGERYPKSLFQDHFRDCSRNGSG